MDDIERNYTVDHALGHGHFFVIQMLTPDLFEFGNLLVYLLRTVVRVAKMTSFASKIQYLE